MHTQCETVAMPATSPAIPMTGTITETTMTKVFVSKGYMQGGRKGRVKHSCAHRDRAEYIHALVCVSMYAHSTQHMHKCRNMHMYVVTPYDHSHHSPIHMHRKHIHALTTYTHTHECTHAAFLSECAALHSCSHIQHWCWLQL